MVVPEDVGGGDVDSAFFHFSEFAFPSLFEGRGRVDFAHFHDAGFAVAEDGVVGDELWPPASPVMCVGVRSGNVLSAFINICGILSCFT